MRQRGWKEGGGGETDRWRRYEGGGETERVIVRLEYEASTEKGGGVFREMNYIG